MQNEGYTPFLEIPHFEGKIDFLGINSSECLVIEAKVNKWNKALKQAIRYGYGAEKAFVALPAITAKNVSKNYAQLFQAYGIGLIAIGEEDTKILIECKIKKPSGVFKKILIEQAQQRMQSSKNRVTEFVTRFKQ
jgi:hypothetical protein